MIKQLVFTLIFVLSLLPGKPSHINYTLIVSVDLYVDGDTGGGLPLWF